MHDALRHGKALPGFKLYGSVLQIDEDASFTLHKDWLYQRSLQAAMSAGTSTRLSGVNLMSRCVAYG